MRARDGTLAFLTIFAWLVGCGLSGPPTPPPESPLSLPEKIFNKIGENAKLIMVLLYPIEISKVLKPTNNFVNTNVIPQLVE